MSTPQPPPGPSQPPSMPPVVPGPGAPSSVTGSERLVHFEGSVQLFTSTMPESSFVDFSDAGNHLVFVGCWIDGTRGDTTHVTFQAGGGVGTFKMSLPFREDDYDKLKIQVSMRMRDDGSKNRRTVPLCSSCAYMQTMLSGGTDEFQMPDEFIEGSYARVSMSITNVGDFQKQPLRLRASSLNRLPVMNASIDRIGASIADDSVKNNLSYKNGGVQMKDGGTRCLKHSRDWAGRVNLKTGEIEIPNVKSHYAIMSAQQECVLRPLPIAIVSYHLYLKLVHSGMTAQEALALSDEKYGQFIGQGLQINCDAAVFPYEMDFVPGLSLSFFEGVTIAAVPTENMAWPLSMGQLDGRTIRDLRPIRVGGECTTQDLLNLFIQPPLPPGSIRTLNPKHQYVAHVAETEENVLPEQYPMLAADDCESSALFAEQAKQSLVLFYRDLNRSRMRGGARVEALKRACGYGSSSGGVGDNLIEKSCSGWKVFEKFTPDSWVLMLRLLDRGGAMLHDGHLKVMTAIGLATNASAAEEVSDKAEYCGHCFNVGTIKTPSMSKAVPFLLEGTASMYSLTVTDSSPRVTATVYDNPEGTGEGRNKIFDMVEFLSALATTLMQFTQVINAPNGGMPQNRGWPLHGKVTGWLAKTCVSHALDSSPSSHLSFYSRIMYMGWPCTTTGQGCMPVQESHATGNVAGCHPFDLTNQDLRGVDATLNAEDIKLMTEIMDEIVPPQAPLELVQKIANLWLPCRPFETVNTDAIREPGVEYNRVVVMEAPCAPEYLTIIHAAKSKLAARTNEINDKRPDSDHINLLTYLEGNSALLCADVRNQDIKHVTVIESLKQAMAELQWPKRTSH